MHPLPSRVCCVQRASRTALVSEVPGTPDRMKRSENLETPHDADPKLLRPLARSRARRLRHRDRRRRNSHPERGPARPGQPGPEHPRRGGGRGRPGGYALGPRPLHRLRSDQRRLRGPAHRARRDQGGTARQQAAPHRGAPVPRARRQGREVRYSARQGHHAARRRLLQDRHGRAPTSSSPTVATAPPGSSPPTSRPRTRSSTSWTR